MPRHLRYLAIALFSALPATAQDGGAEFRDTIRSQLDAFLADDVAGAFTYAAPGIQGMFGTPQNFGAMVQGGYPMVWSPGDVRFLDLHPKRGGMWQRVVITDGAGTTHVLDYQMVETPDGLRIGAVEILPDPGVGT